MARTTTSRPVQAVVLGSLAFLVAVGGTATAVTKIGTKSLRNRAVTTKKIRDAAVTGVKLEGGAVGTEHLQDDAVTGPKIAADAVTGSTVEDGSLGLADISRVAVNVAYNPPSLATDACAESSDISVPGMSGSDEILVLPGGSLEGWPVDLFLDAYGPSGEGSIRVRVCFYGTPSVNAGDLPLRVLLFR